MTEEAEKQDFRLELAQQVLHLACCSNELLMQLDQPRLSSAVCLQVFLFRTAGVTGTDKAKLQQQILETIFSNGAQASPLSCPELKQSALLLCTIHDQGNPFLV